MSILSAFPFIGEQSFATPGAFNSPLSIISANIAAVNAAAGSVSGVTITPPSGNTITIASDLSVLGTIAAGPARLGVSSNLTNYLFLSDTSHARSNYVIGSQVGGTADGLNIWDDSGQTMLVSFSKQSIRFYQQVVGPVFDLGGALTGTYNASTFGTASNSTESRIQAAINQAAADVIPRVYLPKSFYPYSTSSVSFIASVQMVREGGDWTVYDVLAYGVPADDNRDHTFDLQSIESIRPVNAFVTFPAGTYLLSQSLATQLFRIIKAGTYDFRGAVLKYGGAVNLTTGSDGGGLGVINVLTDDVELWGKIHCNNKARYGIARKGQTQRLGLFGSILSTLTASGVWSGIWQRASADITGGAYAGLYPAKALYGWLTRPDCPIMDTNNSIVSTNNISAALLGGDAPAGDNTGVAMAMGGAYEVQAVRLDVPGIRNAMKPLEDNDVLLDLLCHDLGCNTFELHGSAPSTGSNGYPPNTIWGQFVKSGANSGWFHYNVFSGGTMFPNVNLSGGSALYDGRLDIFGQIRGFDGSATTAVYSFRSETSLGLFRSGASVIALNYGQFAYPAGSSVTPSIGFSSETSLGFFRSASSTVALSYGTFKLAPNDRPESLALWHTGGGNWRIGKIGNNTGLLTVSTDSGGLVLGSGVAANVFLQTGGGFTRITVNSGGTVEFANAQYIPTGTALLPSLGLASELSLGLYRSGVSTLGLSYGALAHPDGSNATPSIAYSSNTSLGFYSSGVQTIAQSLGTLNLATNAVRLSMRTIAASALTASAANTNVAVNECVFTVSASGASFAINSGGTTWVFNSDASAKNT